MLPAFQSVVLVVGAETSDEHEHPSTLFSRGETWFILFVLTSVGFAGSVLALAANWLWPVKAADAELLQAPVLELPDKEGQQA